jgi:hypothetical protein
MSRDGERRHLTWAEILDAMESPAGIPAPVLQHLEQCDRCRDLGRAAGDLLGRMETARLPRVPDRLVEGTLQRVLQGAGAEARRSSPIWDRLVAGLRQELEELRAGLVADSQAALAAARGGRASAAQTRLFETDDWMFSIALDRKSGRDECMLRGQIIPRREEVWPPGSRAILGQSDDTVRDADLDDLGEFCFDTLPVGPVRLAVVLGSRFVLLGPFQTDG